MDNFKKLQEVVAAAQVDAEKFYNSNNSAAGTRLRKALQDIKILAGDIRKEVTEIKNSK
ncbi:histone H1 [Pedobacter sp. GR22-6]|uniref:histone H1 n=1 Tax=Pedobacter sp. GR22-6 TaxID=3127957 RepID=UPI00307DDCAB